MNSTLQVLLVDDSPSDRALIARQIRQRLPEVSILEVQSGDAFQHAMEVGRYDLLITDHQLNWGDGLTVLRTSLARWPGRPVIMFTGTGSEEVAVEGMKSGLEDYIVKSPRNYARLAEAARQALETTHQRRSRQELEVRYQRLFEGVPLALIRFAPDGRLLDGNAALLELLGFPGRSHLVQARLGDLFVSREEAEAFLGPLEAQGVRVGHEARLRRVNGRQLWGRLSARAWTVGGEPLFYEGAIEDVSLWHQSEQSQRFLVEVGRRLAESLDPSVLANIIATLTVPTLADWCVLGVVDEPQLRLAAVAHVDQHKQGALRELYEQSPVALTSKHPAADAVRTGRRAAHFQVTQELLGKLARRPEYQGRLDDLGCRACVVLPLKARGRVVAVLTLGYQAPESLTAAQVAQAEDFAERAALAMDNARLYQEAESAIQLRDDFLSFAAHELKTPLATLMAYSQHLLRLGDQATPEQLRRAFSSINRQSARIHRLIQRMLELSSLASGQLSLGLTSFDIRRVVEEAIAQIQIMLLGHSLTTVSPISPVRVRGDPVRTRQVLLNLLENAVRFSPRGGEIRVSVEEEQAEAVVSVADRGIGIPRERQAGIFSRFFRAHQGADRFYGGLGTGLWICKELIERQQGRIWFTSEENQGSTFFFSLPREAAPR